MDSMGGGLVVFGITTKRYYSRHHMGRHLRIRGAGWPHAVHFNKRNLLFLLPRLQVVTGVSLSVCLARVAGGDTCQLDSFFVQPKSQALIGAVFT